MKVNLIKKITFLVRNSVSDKDFMALKEFFYKLNVLGLARKRGVLDKLNSHDTLTKQLVIESLEKKHEHNV